MKGRRGQICCIVAVLVIFIIISGVFFYNYIGQKGLSIREFVSGWVLGAKTSTADTAQDINEEQIPEETDLPNPTVTILTVGDVMMHDGQIWAGYDEKTDTFNYSEFFHVVKDEIASADIAMADLETTLGGKEQKYTGYPMFNSPDELADTLKETGFDVIITSNNHSLDRGVKGALRTIKVLKERGLDPVGTYESEEDREQILIKEANGINIASTPPRLLSYPIHTAPTAYPFPPINSIW